MKKWTKAERAEASRKGKERWAERKKRDVRRSVATMQMVPAASVGGGSANASSYTSANQVLAIDVVRLIGHDVPADVIVKVVERILRP
jgi:hypothetical protein